MANLIYAAGIREFLHANETFGRLPLTAKIYLPRLEDMQVFALLNRPHSDRFSAQSTKLGPVQRVELQRNYITFVFMRAKFFGFLPIPKQSR